MSETNAADRWITTMLTGDAQLAALIGAKVYADLAPQTTPPAALPYVIFTMLSGVDLGPVGPYRIWTNCLYLVKGMAETNSYGGNLKTIADRIDAVLQAGSGSNVDGIIHACVRVEAHRLTEPPVNGRVFRQLGGRYRLFASVP